MTITKAGALASFYMVNKTPIKHLRVYFSPKQSGSGDPSPENVRAIEGWDGVEVTHCGKNLYNPTNVIMNQELFPAGDLYPTGASNNWCVSDYMPVKPNTTYIATALLTKGSGRYALYDENKNYIRGAQEKVGADAQTIITTDANARYIRLTVRIGDKLNTIFEEDVQENTSTYYSGQFHTIDWSNDIGTVYGGYVDLVTGEVVKTWTARPISQMAVIKTNGSGVWQHRFDIRAPWVSGIGYEEAGGAYQAICSIFSFGTAETNFTYRTYAGLIDVYDDTTETAEDFQTKYGEYAVAYNIRSELYEHYQLTPIQLSTLLGRNNIWSNADRVEIEYDLAESNDILYRRRNVLEQQYPHIITPAASGLINFNTDMKAPLKQCKVYFNPVQEGEGDPSPENVRAISGWTGIEVYRTGKNMLDTATSDEILENWTLINPTYQKNIEKLPTNLDFVLQANITKDLEENISNCRLYMYGALTSGKFINTATPLGIHTVTNKPDASGMLRIGHNYIGLRPDRYGATFNNMQLELGSVATTYEPYQGIVLPIDWADEAGTVYGGYVDLVSGEIVAEWIAFDMTQLTLTQFSAESNLSIISAFPGIIKSRNKMYCNILTPTSNPNISGIEGIDWNNGRVNICLSASRGLDSQAKIEQWLNDFKNNGTTPLIVANMATPVTYSIDPQTLKTLRGTNNIWSNANGNIELSYWKH